MPKVIYRGATHELVVGDKVLQRDGEAVDLTNEELEAARGASPDVVLEVEGSTAKAATPPPAAPTEKAGGSN